MIGPTVKKTFNPLSDIVDIDAGFAGQAKGEQPTALRISVQELTLGLVGIMVWFGLFTGGILLPTEPYRNAIGNPTASATLILSWLIVCAFWTISNIGVLSCVAAFLGALGRRANFTLQSDRKLHEFNLAHSQTNGITTYYLSALLRGFGVYSLVLAGLLVLATESLISPTQAAYMRLAPTVSIISFYAGYDPSFFAGLLDKVKSFLQNGNSKPS